MGFAMPTASANGSDALCQKSLSYLVYRDDDRGGDGPGSLTACCAEVCRVASNRTRKGKFPKFFQRSHFC